MDSQNSAALPFLSHKFYSLSDPPFLSRGLDLFSSSGVRQVAIDESLAVAIAFVYVLKIVMFARIPDPEFGSSKK